MLQTIGILVITLVIRSDIAHAGVVGILRQITHADDAIAGRAIASLACANAGCVHRRKGSPQTGPAVAAGPVNRYQTN